jgi:hypothetical protein
MTPQDHTKNVGLAYIALGEALLASVDDGVSSTPPYAQPVPTAAPAPAPQPVAAAPAPENVGFCPQHGTPWTTTKGDGTPAKRAYCKTKNGDEWCQEKGPWLQPRRA